MDIFLDVGKSSHEVAHVVLHVLCCVRVGFGSLLAINIPEYSYSVLDSRRVCSEGLYLFQQIDQFDLGLLEFLPGRSCSLKLGPTFGLAGLGAEYMMHQVFDFVVS